MLGALTAGPLAAQSIDEIKAAFVFNFVKFATWPESKMTGDTIHICVEAGSLDGEVFEGWDEKVLKDKAVVVDIVEFPGPDLARCHVLYVGDRGGQAIEDAPFYDNAIAGHVLLVSGSENFIERGGHIRLFIMNSKLSFEVNLEAIAEADISLSSQLLRLASNLGS